MTTPKVSMKTDLNYGPDTEAERLERMKRLSLVQLAQTSLWRLDALTSVIEEAEKMRAELIATLREEGTSWTVIGQNLGVSKQAARQRYSTTASTPVDPAQMEIDV